MCQKTVCQKTVYQKTVCRKTVCRKTVFQKTDETLEAVPRDLAVNTAVNQRKQNSERSINSTTNKHTFCSQIR